MSTFWKVDSTKYGTRFCETHHFKYNLRKIKSVIILFLFRCFCFSGEDGGVLVIINKQYKGN